MRNFFSRAHTMFVKLGHNPMEKNLTVSNLSSTWTTEFASRGNRAPEFPDFPCIRDVSFLIQVFRCSANSLWVPKISRFFKKKTHIKSFFFVLCVPIYVMTYFYHVFFIFQFLFLFPNVKKKFSTIIVDFITC